MTNVKQIRFAYSSTSQCMNQSIEEYLKDPTETNVNAVYDILHYMRLEKSPFGVQTLTFYNGVKKFQVLYKIGKFEIIVATFNANDEFPFNTVKSFSKWLNDQESKIIDNRW